MDIIIQIFNNARKNDNYIECNDLINNINNYMLNKLKKQNYKKKQYKNWFKLKSSIEFINETQYIVNIENGYDKILIDKSIKKKLYVHPYIAINIIIWTAPILNIYIIKLFNKIITGDLTINNDIINIYDKKNNTNTNVNIHSISNKLLEENKTNKILLKFNKLKIKKNLSKINIININTLNQINILNLNNLNSSLDKIILENDNFKLKNINIHNDINLFSSFINNFLFLNNNSKYNEFLNFYKNNNIILKFNPIFLSIINIFINLKKNQNNTNLLNQNNTSYFYIHQIKLNNNDIIWSFDNEKFNEFDIILSGKTNYFNKILNIFSNTFVTLIYNTNFQHIYPKNSVKINNINLINCYKIILLNEINKYTDFSEIQYF